MSTPTRAARTSPSRPGAIRPPELPSFTDFQQFMPAGDAPRRGIGAAGLGADGTAFVDLRLWVDFDGGSGPNVNGASLVSANLYRSGVASGMPVPDANVHWLLFTHAREGWTTLRATVRYTDAEIAGLNENGLALYRADVPTGPWTLLGDVVRNPARNEISALVPRVQDFYTDYLAIGDPTRFEPLIIPTFASPTPNQAPTWAVLFLRDVGSTFTAADVIPTGTLASGAVVFVAPQSPDTYNVTVATSGESVEGTIGFEIPLGSVEGTGGSPINMPSTAPLMTVDEVTTSNLADVDASGSVNVGDITRLGNFLDLGEPLP